jgi:hypothetical protein
VHFALTIRFNHRTVLKGLRIVANLARVMSLINETDYFEPTLIYYLKKRPLATRHSTKTNMFEWEYAQ